MDDDPYNMAQPLTTDKFTEAQVTDNEKKGILAKSSSFEMTLIPSRKTNWSNNNLQ